MNAGAATIPLHPETGLSFRSARTLILLRCNGAGQQPVNGIMKKATLLLLNGIFLISLACQKKQSSGQTTLTGTWKFTESYFSIGGPANWRPADPPGQTITFNADGRFQHSGGIFNTYSEFQQVDSVTIRLIPTTRSSIAPEFRFTIDGGGDVLTLTPTNPVCIEGCAYRFERIFIR